MKLEVKLENSEYNARCVGCDVWIGIGLACRDCDSGDSDHKGSASSEMSVDRIHIYHDEQGYLDELVAELAHVHLERMSTTEWTLIVASRGRKVIITLGTKRAPIEGFVYEDSTSQRNPGE